MLSRWGPFELSVDEKCYDQRRGWFANAFFMEQGMYVKFWIGHLEHGERRW